MRSFPIAIVLCLVAAMASAQAPLVAVMPLETNEVSPGESQLLCDAIGTRLQKTGAFRVMERSQMEKVLAEQGFQQSGACNGTECAVQVGQVLGIDRMVVGSVGRMGTAWVLNLRMVSVSTGEVLASSSRNQKGEIADLITEMAPLAVSDLVDESAKTTKQADPAKEPKVEQGSSHAWLWWTLGGVAVVGGGAAAAILLLSDDGSSDPAPNSDPAKTTGSFEVKWK